MILSSSSLDFFNPPYIVALTGLLWISLTDTYNNNFVTSCGSVWPSIFTFRQSLIIGDSKTCWWCIIQLWRDIFICSSIFEFTFLFCFNAHSLFLNLIALRLYLAAPTWRKSSFFTFKILVNRHSDFRAHGFLIGVHVLGDIVLLLVNPSGV